MLTRLTIENFRSIEKCDLTLKPLTFIVGRNNVGKSSLVLPLVLLRSWLKNAWPPLSNNATVTLGTELHNSHPALWTILGNYGDMVHGGDRKKLIRFEVYFSLGPTEQNELANLLGSVPWSDGSETNRNDKQSEKIIPIIHDLQFNASGLGYALAFNGHPMGDEFPTGTIREQRFLDGAGNTIVGLVTDKIQTGPDVSQHIDRLSPEYVKQYAHPDSWRLLMFLRDFGSAPHLPQLVHHCAKTIHSSIMTVHFIGEVRDRIPRLSPLGEDPEEVGFNGENALSLAAFRFGQRKHAKGHKEFLRWMERLGAGEIGLAHGTMTAGVGENRRSVPGVFWEAPGPGGVPLNIASFGSGIQLLAPVVVQCFAAGPGATIVIEEPEIHLHPENQRLMVDLFHDAVKFGNQIIAATHSEHFIYRLQTLVANGDLKPEDIAIIEVTAGKNGTEIEPIPMDSNGNLDHWPRSFAETGLKAHNELSKAQRKSDG
jgi:hypothetical protein